MLGQAQSHDRGHAGVKTFRVQLWLLIIVYTVLVYGGIFVLIRAQLLDSLEQEGASYFDLVLTTRQWNAGHGGVWVIEQDGKIANEEFLRASGIEPKISTDVGVGLVLRNPSEMTREISELTRLESGVTFHLAGNDPVNPANAPDEWEAEALEEFENGARNATTVDDSGALRIYRYMEPLFVDETCLSCHGSEDGYSIGDQRGGVSLDIPMGEYEQQVDRIGVVLLLFALMSIAAGVATTQLLIGRLSSRINEANERLRYMAVTDELTGILNRRAAFSRLAEECQRTRRTNDPLSVISLDIDNFKKINDAHGHSVGDCALNCFVKRTTESMRAYDILGRVGGEEFLIIAPNTDIEQAGLVAERVLENLRSKPLSHCSRLINLTASAGVAQICTADHDFDALLLRADQALYRAKGAGRDRVAYDPPDSASAGESVGDSE